MTTGLKTKSWTTRTNQGGFLELIIIIVIALLIMKYYGWTVTELINWFLNYFKSVLR